jgi:hypothetical protein
MASDEAGKVASGVDNHLLDPGNVGHKGIGIEGGGQLDDRLGGACQHNQVDILDRLLSRPGDGIEGAACHGTIEGGRLGIPTDHLITEAPKTDSDGSTNQTGAEDGRPNHRISERNP